MCSLSTNAIVTRRFESCCSGLRPRTTIRSYELLANVCNALTIVQTCTVPGACMPCDANPFKLFCKCKGCRKIGICSHVLLVTHEMMKGLPKREQKASCNLNYMLGGIAGASTKPGRPRRVKHCLQKESSSEDSGDEQDAHLQW